MNEYRKALCREASDNLGKASALLRSINCSVGFVEGMEFHSTVLESVKAIIDDLAGEYLRASRGEE